MNAHPEAPVDGGVPLAAHRTLMKVRIYLCIVICLMFMGVITFNVVFTCNLLNVISPYFMSHDLESKHDEVFYVSLFMYSVAFIYAILFIILAKHTMRDLVHYKLKHPRTYGYNSSLFPARVSKHDLGKYFSLNTREGLIVFIICLSIHLGTQYGLGTYTLMITNDWTDHFKTIYHESGNIDQEASSLAIECTELYTFTALVMMMPGLTALFWAVFYRPAIYHIVKMVRAKQAEERELYEQRLAAAQAWMLMRDLTSLEDVERWMESRGRPPSYAETPPSTGRMPST